MPALKKAPAHQAKVILIKPAYVSLKDAQSYVGMKRTSFTEARVRHGLKVYSYGTLKMWFKVSELDEMMESFCIINNPNKKAIAQTTAH